MRPIIGRFDASRSPPAPNTEISRPPAKTHSRAAINAFFNASGVCAKSTTTSGRRFTRSIRPGICATSPSAPTTRDTSYPSDTSAVTAPAAFNKLYTPANGNPPSNTPSAVFTLKVQRSPAQTYESIATSASATAELSIFAFSIFESSIFAFSILFLSTALPARRPKANVAIRPPHDSGRASRKYLITSASLALPTATGNFPAAKLRTKCVSNSRRFASP